MYCERPLFLELSAQICTGSEQEWPPIWFQPVGTGTAATKRLSSPMMERKLFVQQDRKSVDELFEFLSRRMCLNGVVHDAYPELGKGLIIHATSPFGVRILPYSKRNNLQCIFKTMSSQNEPREPKMSKVSEIAR